jgi:hypothetical protein
MHCFTEQDPYPNLYNALAGGGSETRALTRCTLWRGLGTSFVASFNARFI